MLRVGARTLAYTGGEIDEVHEVAGDEAALKVPVESAVEGQDQMADSALQSSRNGRRRGWLPSQRIPEA